MSSNLAEKTGPSSNRGNREMTKAELDEVGRRSRAAVFAAGNPLGDKFLKALNLPGSGTPKDVARKLKEKGVVVVSVVDEVPSNSVGGRSGGAMKVKDGTETPKSKPKKEPKTQRKAATPKPIEHTEETAVRTPQPSKNAVGAPSAPRATLKDKVENLEGEIANLEKRLEIARGKKEEWPWAEKEIEQLKKELFRFQKESARDSKGPPPRKSKDAGGGTGVTKRAEEHTVSTMDEVMSHVAREMRELDRNENRTPEENKTMRLLREKLETLKRKRFELPPLPSKKTRSKRRKKPTPNTDPQDWRPEDEQKNLLAGHDDPPKNILQSTASARVIVSPANTKNDIPAHTIGAKPRAFVRARDDGPPDYNGTYLTNELARMNTERVTVSPAQLEKDAAAHMESLSPEERKTFLEGVANAGCFIQEKKSAFWETAFEMTAYITPKGSMLHRFLSVGFASVFRKEKESARAQQETVGKNFAQKAVEIGTGTGVLIKYGRVITDAIGISALATNPLRWVTISSMVFGRTSEAIKEARLSYDSAREKTRVGDINRAADEAWAFYEKARAGGETITADALKRAYANFLPEDVYTRLSRMDFAGFGVMQTLAHKNILRTVERIKEKMTGIDESDLSVEEKDVARERELIRYRAFLSDMDRIVGDMGMIDMFAYGARLGERGGKMAANIMALETLAEGATWLFQAASAFELGTLAEQTPDGSVTPPSKEADADAITRVKTQIHEILGSSHTVIKGDNAWNIISTKVGALQEQGLMPKLSEAQNARLVKNLEIKLAGMSPEELQHVFGFSSGNIHDIRPDDVLNLSPILENNVALPDAIQDATNLTPAQEESILASNETRREWAREHPGQPFPETDPERARGNRHPSEGAPAGKDGAPEAAASPEPPPRGELAHERASDAGIERAIAEGTRAGVAEIINERFGRSGLFGFIGTTSGMESDEWQYMKDMPVTRILGRLVLGASEEEVGKMGELIQEITLEAHITHQEKETVEQFVSRGMEKMIRARTPQ